MTGRIPPPARAPRASAPGLALLIGLAAGGAACADADGDPFASTAPYVQDARPDSMVVAHLTASPRRLRVECEPADAAPGAATIAVEEAAAGTAHGLRIEGLAPDSRYAYRVLDADSGLAVGGSTFRTAPIPGPDAREIRVAVVGDSGGIAERESGERLKRRLKDVIRRREHPLNAGQIAARMAADEPDLVLHTGDLVYEVGARDAYAEAFFRPFAALIDHVPLYPVLGNHDVKTESGAPFLDVFHLPENSPAPERYYSFDYGPVHFVALATDTDEVVPGSDQQRWLADDLAGPAATAARWRIAFFHRPPFTEGQHFDNSFVQETFIPVFERYGVDLVVTGHDHNYQRFYPVNGITYVVTGGGGKTLYEVRSTARTAYVAAVDHHVRLSIGATALRLEAVSKDGLVFDSFAVEKAP